MPHLAQREQNISQMDPDTYLKSSSRLSTLAMATCNCGKKFELLFSLRAEIRDLGFRTRGDSG
jgi:hypothetical protein